MSAQLHLADGGDYTVHDLPLVRPQDQARVVHIEECCAQAFPDLSLADIPHPGHAHQEAILP